MWKTFPVVCARVMIAMVVARTRNGSKSEPNRCFSAYSLSLSPYRSRSSFPSGKPERVGLLLPGLVQVLEGGLEEAAGAAGRVQHALVRLRVEHRDHQVDRAARGEVLARSPRMLC